MAKEGDTLIAPEDIAVGDVIRFRPESKTNTVTLQVTYMKPTIYDYSILVTGRETKINGEPIKTKTGRYKYRTAELIRPFTEVVLISRNSVIKEK